MKFLKFLLIVAAGIGVFMLGRLLVFNWQGVKLEKEFMRIWNKHIQEREAKAEAEGI